MRFFIAVSLFSFVSLASHAEQAVTVRVDSDNYQSVSWHGDITSTVTSPGYHRKTCHGAVKIRLRTGENYVLPMTTVGSYKTTVAEAAAFDCEAGLASHGSSLFDALESIEHREIREKIESVIVNGQPVTTRYCYRTVITVSISPKAKIDGLPVLLGHSVRQLPVACP